MLSDLDAGTPLDRLCAEPFAFLNFAHTADDDGSAERKNDEVKKKVLFGLFLHPQTCAKRALPTKISV